VKQSGLCFSSGMFWSTDLLVFFSFLSFLYLLISIPTLSCLLYLSVTFFFLSRSFFFSLLLSPSPCSSLLNLISPLSSSSEYPSLFSHPSTLMLYLSLSFSLSLSCFLSNLSPPPYFTSFIK
jgi:hypothetical protein